MVNYNVTLQPPSILTQIDSIMVNYNVTLQPPPI